MFSHLAVVGVDLPRANVKLMAAGIMLIFIRVMLVEISLVPLEVLHQLHMVALAKAHA